VGGYRLFRGGDLGQKFAGGVAMAAGALDAAFNVATAGGKKTLASGVKAGIMRLVGGASKELLEAQSKALGRASLRNAARTAETLPGKLYHYTGAGNAESILKNGLGAGGRRTFATPAGNLSPVQAQIELALPANRGYPGALFEIDTARLQQLGINPAVGPQRIMSTPNAGGGGIEYIFNQPIPPSAIRQVPFL